MRSRRCPLPGELGRSPGSLGAGPRLPRCPSHRPRSSSWASPRNRTPSQFLPQRMVVMMTSRSSPSACLHRLDRDGICAAGDEVLIAGLMKRPSCLDPLDGLLVAHAEGNDPERLDRARSRRLNHELRNTTRIGPIHADCGDAGACRASEASTVVTLGRGTGLGDHCQ